MPLKLIETGETTSSIKPNIVTVVRCSPKNKDNLINEDKLPSKKGKT